MTSEGEALLVSAVAAMGLDIAPSLEAFAQLQSLLQQAAASSNLTTLKSEHDIVLKHFVDSLTCLRGGFLDGSLDVLDLGTGAGFPGLPLAIARPELRLTLLDATRRKIEFVSMAAASLGLHNVQVLTGRAEWLGRQTDWRGHFDRVVTRAVSSLPALVELALPLLKPGGLLVAQKGRLEEAELEAGRRAAEVVGGHVVQLDRFELPLLQDPRSLVVIRKTRETPARFPRREGMPARHPLF